MSQDNNVMLGLGLIVAAVYMTRRPRATYSQPVGTQAAQQRGPLGAGSMPGSVGSGLAQQIGGALGNALAKQWGGGTSTGVPVTNSGMDLFPTMAGDGVIQNSVPDADPAATFDPGFMDSGPLFGTEGWA